TGRPLCCAFAVRAGRSHLLFAGNPALRLVNPVRLPDDAVLPALPAPSPVPHPVLVYVEHRLYVLQPVHWRAGTDRPDRDRAAGLARREPCQSIPDRSVAGGGPALCALAGRPVAPV